MSFSDQVAREARVRILKELARQTDGRMNEVLIQRTLDVFGIPVSPGAVRWS